MGSILVKGVEDAMTKIDGTLDLLKARSRPAKEKHRQDVAYVQKEYPELAAWLTDITKTFGRCEYRITLWRSDDV